jgi:hypothetical protein
VRIVHQLLVQIILLVVVGLLVWHHVDAIAIAVPAGMLVVGLLYAYVPKVDDTQNRMPRPPNGGTGKLPGSPDRALITELIRARRAAKSGDDLQDSSPDPYADRRVAASDHDPPSG